MKTNSLAGFCLPQEESLKLQGRGGTRRQWGRDNSDVEELGGERGSERKGLLENISL